MKLCSNSAMRKAEEHYMRESGTSDAALMERAIKRLHHAVAQEIKRGTIPPPDEIIVAAGSGKNAGDALGLARALGRPTRVLGDRFHPLAQQQFEALQAAGLLISRSEPLILRDGLQRLLIDGVLGTGAEGPLRPEGRALVEQLTKIAQQEPRAVTLAIDLPSGLNLPDSPCIRANVTACIGAAKEALVHDEALDWVGCILPIPLPEVDPYLPEGGAKLITLEDLAPAARPPMSLYKRSAGVVHVLAGSRAYYGAAQLAAESALEHGAGMVILHCPAECYDILATRLRAEILLRPWDALTEIDLSGASSLLIGPGLGSLDHLCAEDRTWLVGLITQPPCPLILDADGIRFAAREQLQLSADCLLTPHPGEMTQWGGAQGGRTRLQWARDTQSSHGGCLLLKGERPFYLDAQGVPHYIAHAGPTYAQAGMGDKLAGRLAAYRARALF